MDVFYENVMRAIPSSRFKSREELSAFVFDGKGKYLANAQNKGHELSLRRAKKIATALGVTLDELTDADMPDRGAQDHTMAIVSAVEKSKSTGDLGGLIDFVDLYHEVQEIDQTLRPFRLGKYSLLSKILQRSDLANIRRGLKSLRPEMDAKLRTSYEAAAAGVPVLSVETFNEEIAVEPYHVSVRYARLLLSVQGPQQQPLVLTYCYQLPRE